jgi:hypothetical protein
MLAKGRAINSCLRPTQKRALLPAPSIHAMIHALRIDGIGCYFSLQV